MSTLSDHVDRITELARSIRSAAASTSGGAGAPAAGPFTRAVLQTPLGDLIRDIDPSELGLFTLMPPTKPQAHPPHDGEAPGPPPAEIARVEFLGATPLRKPPAPKPGRTETKGPGEHDPEVYARAALKYLDRYQSIRSMPRAVEQASHIMERLEEVRGNIQQLNERLKQATTAGPSQPPPSPKTAFAEEERKIQDTHNRIAELKKRKENLLKPKTSFRLATRAPPKAKPQTPEPAPTSPQDPAEETFWNTPAAAARTLHFTGDSLMDEDVHEELADVSAFASPLPVRSGAGSATDDIPSPKANLSDPAPGDDEPEEENAVEGAILEQDSVDRAEEEEASDAEDETVVMRKIVPPPEPVHTSVDIPSPIRSSSALSDAASSTETPSSSSRRSKVKVTTELEHISTRIWSTIGEVIMPGHRFDVSGEGGNKPPRAKETITHLQALSARTPSPSSPSTSSLSSYSTAALPPASSPAQVTAQQILTAHMLLALLDSPPQYALPLNRLKEVLAGKAVAGVGASGVTRPIYGCVAKRLLRIDRGGGEQVVRFDI